jgi:hypothetical protein
VEEFNNVPLNFYRMRKKKAKPVSEVSIKALAKSILDLHGCKAMWVKSAPVKEIFEGETAWEGVVQVFEIDHPKSKLCYAWSHGLDDSKKRRFFAVLHQGAVDSPEKAVRGAIVNEFRTTKPGRSDFS